MDFGSSKFYEIELWSQSGSRIADISHLCSNRKYTLQRNEAETLTFDVDLFKFEDYCQNNLGGTDPHTLLAPYVTDVKVKRNGSYLFGAQVVDISFDLTADDSQGSSSSPGSSNYKVTVTCSGYLNLFKDRYTSNAYTQWERVAIVTDLITTTQAQTNGSVGVTINTSQYSTGTLSDRTYQRDQIKLKIQEMAALTDAPFDFWFTYNKQFNTAAKQGARRQDLSFIYGGPLSNVAGFSLDRSGANLYNRIYGIGSGFGADQLINSPGTGDDTASQINYYLRENIVQFNSVTIQSTLDQNTAASLALSKDILELPKITITGNDLKGKSPISVGDRIPLKVNSHPWLSNINGLYRVEQLDVTIDENDFESEILVTFDNYGVNQSE